MLLLEASCRRRRNKPTDSWPQSRMTVKRKNKICNWGVALAKQREKRTPGYIFFGTNRKLSFYFLCLWIRKK